MPGFYCRHDVLAAATRQVHVQQHHIRRSLGNLGDRWPHVVGLPDDVDVPGQLRPDP